MGRQSDQVERAACGSGKSINFYQIKKDAQNVAALKNNKWVITEIDS